MQFMLLFQVGCIAPTPTTTTTTTSHDSGDTAVLHTGDSGSTTTGVTSPPPGWQAAADVGVVWHGRPDTHTGDDVVVWAPEGAPLLVVGAPRPSDLGGPFPILVEDAGPRVLEAPFAGGIVQDAAVAGWRWPDDVDPYHPGLGQLGIWLEPAGDVRGDGTELLFFDGDLYRLPGAVVPHEEARESTTQMSAPRSCDLSGTGAVDLVAPSGVALGPVPLPLPNERFDTDWRDQAGQPLHIVACGDIDLADQGDEIVTVTREEPAAVRVVLDAPPSGDPVVIGDIAAATWTGPAPLSGGQDRGLIASADLDGDGVVDVVVGGPGIDESTDDGLRHGGRMWVLTDPLLGGDLDTGAHMVLEASYNGDRPGANMATGDFDGDGQDDLAVGYGIPSRVAVFRGPLPAGTVTDADADAVFYGQDSLEDGFGKGLAAGDLDEDGRDDLIIGAPQDDTEGTNAGAVYLLWGGGL